ncbi:hypothetical protein AAF712_006675 [Marasmius tenuissimus]|uniref:Uncharacterized protein n=1 Tax=Marasmius tenuissimus TaxID=585030 RepID=A0ABR2ZYN0_9AGAR
MCTLVDQSVNLLVFYGLINLCFFPNKGGLARMNIIHTSRPGEDLKKSLVSYRANWLDIGNLASRSAKFKIDWSNGGRTNYTDPERNLPDIRVAPNSNHWIYPYMLGKQPHEGTGVYTDGSVVAQINLTRRSLIRTAALAVARFAIFLASSIIIILLHIFIIAFFYEDKLVRALLILGDLGRWLLVVGQLSSILTYSLDYKGVCSWGSPRAYKDNPIYGARWSPGEQLFCRGQVLQYIGRAYHARLVFLMCDYMWPKIAYRMPPKWQYIYGTPDNCGIFSVFTCLEDRYFEDVQSTLLRLHVKPRGRGDLSNDFTSVGSYAIDFKVPTLLVQYCFTKRLAARFWQRVWNFVALAPLCLCSIVVPYLLVWVESDSKIPALIVLGFFQVIAIVLTYKDIDDFSINCKFQPDSPNVIQSVT